MSSASIMGDIIAKKAKKAEYELRKSQISGINNNIPGVSDDNVTYINNKIDKVIEQLNAGITGINIECFVLELEALKEAKSDSDSKLSSAITNLESEESDCTRKIKELESTISDLYDEYYDELEREAEERRKYLEELAEKAEQAMGNLVEAITG